VPHRTFAGLLVRLRLRDAIGNGIADATNGTDDGHERGRKHGPTLRERGRRDRGLSATADHLGIGGSRQHRHGDE